MATEMLRSSRIVATKEVVCCDLVGETAILHLKSGIYFGLNKVGTRIWNMIQEPVTVDFVLNQLVAEYDVRLDHCETDLYALVQDLISHNLVVVDTETLAGNPHISQVTSNANKK